MEDKRIVDLYWARSEDAIAQTQIKYGKLLYRLSFSLLSSHEDAEECVNDTYIAAWGAMPDERPDYLCAFLCKIDRRISMNKYKSKHAQKRGGAELIIEELTDCIPANDDFLREDNDREIAEAINEFLSSLKEEKRVVFVKRYFYSESISDIAKEVQISEEKVKSMLHRMRIALQVRLNKEGLL